MEILERGVPPEEKEVEGMCNHYKTRIKFQVKEGEVGQSQRDGDWVTMTCPVCGQKIHATL